MRAFNSLTRQMQVRTEPLNYERSRHAPYCVAEGDAGNAAQNGRRNGWRRTQSALENQVACERQQSLIGHSQAGDAEDQKKKDSGIAVLRNPLRRSLH